MVDQIDPRSYSVELLHSWKSAAESGGPTKRMDALVGIDPGELAAMVLDVLTKPPELQLAWPCDAFDEDLLSFAARHTSHIGREADLRSLNEFLAAMPVTSWWMVLGEAGTGKSRLALELCLVAEGRWHAGFLTESSQDSSARLPTARADADRRGLRLAKGGVVLAMSSTTMPHAVTSTTPQCVCWWLNSALENRCTRGRSEPTDTLSRECSCPVSTPTPYR